MGSQKGSQTQLSTTQHIHTEHIQSNQFNISGPVHFAWFITAEICRDHHRGEVLSQADVLWNGLVLRLSGHSGQEFLAFNPTASGPGEPGAATCPLGKGNEPALLCWVKIS